MSRLQLIFSSILLALIGQSGRAADEVSQGQPAVIFFGKSVAYAPSVVPRPVIAEQGIPLSDVVADFRICNGQVITSLSATVNWHDGSPEENLVPTDPLWQGHLLGRHTFAKAGSFTFSIRMTASCYRDFGSGHATWSESAATDMGTATVYLPVSVTNLTLSSASVVGGSPVDATVVLAAPAPPSGVTVFLSSNKPFAVVPTTLKVPPNARRQTAPVSTTKPTPPGQTATISARSVGPTKTRNLQVN